MTSSQLTRNSLQETHPEIAAQWHPIKNSKLTPIDVSAGSNKKVWWLCNIGKDHEWQATIYNRQNHGCPICSGRVATLSTCLKATNPELAIEWHPTKNGTLTPSNVKASSNKKVSWLCKNGHEWQATVYSRKKNKCPICSGQQVTINTSLAVTNPELATEWHPTKNDTLTPFNIKAGSNKKVWWLCKNRHEWQATVMNRSNRTGCPMCRGKRASNENCLATLYPEIAAQWHPILNGTLTPRDVTPGSDQEIWWRCTKRPDHEWKAPVYNRVKVKSGCPCCSGHKIAFQDSLAYHYPDLANELHPTKNSVSANKINIHNIRQKLWWVCRIDANHLFYAYVKTRVSQFSKGINSCSICNSFGYLFSSLAKTWHPTKNASDPYSLSYGSKKKIWWICDKNPEHIWLASIDNRVKGRNCPECSNKKVNNKNSLASLHPILTLEWHQERNSPLTPIDVVAGSGKIVWWQCSKNKEHIWQAAIELRTKRNYGCPFCNTGWTIEKLRLFVRSLISHIDFLTPAELYVLFQQHEGLLETRGKGRKFIHALKSGVFSKTDLEQFLEHQPSIVDHYITEIENTAIDDTPEISNKIFEKEGEYLDSELPSIETKDILTSLAHNTLIANADGEAVDFFIQSALSKIWQHAFINEQQAQEQLKQFTEIGEFAKQVKSQFEQAYTAIKGLTIPTGYLGPQPNLMQLYITYAIQQKKRYGNWSGTGAGKTLSALITSRAINAKITIICCPNNVIDTWKQEINNHYQSSSECIYTKQLPTKIHGIYNYIILNYEFFQQHHAAFRLNKFLEHYQADFIVLDEIHYAKQRQGIDASKRKNTVLSFLTTASLKNPDIHVLGMSATPVVNDLFEGKGLIEMISGVSHDDLDTRPTISNCVALYKKFITHGIRYLPQLKSQFIEDIIEFDCTEALPEIKVHKTVVELEAILTKQKIPIILKNLRSGTIIYTHYRDGIDMVLYEKIRDASWKVGFFHGEDKRGLQDFKDGTIDILIATSCIGTGVDGLQATCNRLIISCLPWTHAEYKQLIGRIYRQGQTKNVDVIILIGKVNIHEQEWSWCKQRWNRIHYKKTIADAAVDGVLPDGQLRSPAQAHKDAIAWLDRLERGETREIKRQKIESQLSAEFENSIEYHKNEFVALNRKVNTEHSTAVHKKFSANPEEWHRYHSLYREIRKEWDIIPYQEAITWLKKRPHLVVGDFGCGEAFLAKELSNTVHSFDHVAINESITACDMRQLPLSDAALDVAVFSLSLMGSNYIEYLIEANRVLKLDGHLWIAEATSRIKDIYLSQDLLYKLGFNTVLTEQKGQFTFFHALKSDRAINQTLIDNLK